MYEILNGTETSMAIKQEIKAEIEEKLTSKNKRAPKLVVILVGDNMASKVYVAGKVKAAEQVGIETTVIKFDYDVTQAEVVDAIRKLNRDKLVDGILLQLPVPMQINESEVLNEIDPEKDVDGLTYINLGKVLDKDNDGFVGCTPSGVMALLNHYNIDITGKDVTIVNRSLLVGKPLALLMTNANATVTVCHTKTQNLTDKLKNSDIIVTAVGIKDFIKPEMVKKGAIVIDVGITRDEVSKKICGDVDFEGVAPKTSYITPVPGGVGPMTIAMLLKNVLLARLKKEEK